MTKWGHNVRLAAKIRQFRPLAKFGQTYFKTTVLCRHQTRDRNFSMYLFFIRAFNDIDHITPIAWKMHQDGYGVSVYCIDPEYDIHNDYRLAFLRTNGIPVGYLYDAFKDQWGYFQRFIHTVMIASYRLQKKITRHQHSGPVAIRNTLGKCAREMGKLCYFILKTFFYQSTWAQRFLHHTRAKVLCFDHIRPRQYVVGTLLEAAQATSIPVIALPHGVFIYRNDLYKQGATKERGYAKYNAFDYIIIQNPQRKQYLVDSGVQEDKIFALGSTRYCDEWMAQNRQILPRMLKNGDRRSNKLRVVFMTTRFAFRIDVQRMLKTFHLLAQLDDIEVVIKPHTRTGKEAGFYENLPLKNAADTSSVELCEWADITLVIASSILIEALVQAKPVLYLKYLHGNKTLYEEMGACWQINSETELQNALQSLIRNKKNVSYSAENVQKFLSEIIYGGKRKRDVLKDYRQFIVGCAQGAVPRFS